MTRKSFLKILIFLLFALFLLCALSLAYLYVSGEVKDFSDIENIIPGLNSNNSKNPANKSANSSSSPSSSSSSSSSSNYDIPPSASLSDYYTRNYSWEYEGYKQSFSIAISKEHYDYYRNKSHSGREYDFYALSEDDRYSF
jgi:hypothetical protein